MLRYAVICLTCLIVAAGPLYAAPGTSGNTVMTRAQSVLDELAKIEVLLAEKLDELQRAMFQPLYRLQRSRRVLEVLADQLRRFPEILEEAAQRWLDELRRLLDLEGASPLYGAYGKGNPVIEERVQDLAKSEMAAVGGAIHSTAAARVSVALARQASQDSTLRRAARTSQSTARSLSREAPTLPSTRAGIQLLVAGQAEGLRFNAVLGRTLGNRLAGVSQQLATLAEQNASLQRVLSQQLLLQAKEQEDQLKATLVHLDLVRSLTVQTYTRGLAPFLGLNRDDAEDLANLVRWDR